MDADTLIPKYQLTDRHWVEKHLGGTPYFAYAYLEAGTRPMRQNEDDCHSITITFFFRDYTHYGYDHASMIRLRNRFIARVNADPGYLEQYRGDWLKLVQRLEEEIAKVDKTDLQALPDEQLYARYEKYFRTWEEEYAPAFIYQDPFSMDAHNYMPPLFEKYLPPDRFQEYYSLLFAPVNESFINSEKKDLMHIAREANEKGLKTNEGILKELDNRLGEHSKKYFWIENNYAHTKMLDAAYFAQKIQEEMAQGIDPVYEIKKIEDTIPENTRKKNELLHELALPQELINLIRIAECFTYMQDERKKYVLISCHYLQRFLEEFARRTGLPEQELRYVIHPEMEEIVVRKRYDRKRLQDRYQGCVFINTPNGYDVVEGPGAAEVYRAIFKPHIQVDTFKGICASRGKATGPVRIILTVHDLPSMQKGEILVTSMTRPEMIVAVKKAAAIVTDEGGITSHAAIVSREMGIPCVLATQVATRVLKTGDIIEVDANTASVRILKRKDNR